jgi:hypothetical protein
VAAADTATALRTPPDLPLSSADRGARPLARPAWWSAVALFVLLVAGYCAFGTVMVLRYNLFDPDGPSRVANAAFALMSRDPHLSAIGFVWNPLPSLAELPLLPLSRWWPELKTQGLAGVVQSAVFMAAATLMVRRIALDRGVGALWRWVSIACFALNPVIVIYGGSGMSEAAELFCLLWCTRNLLVWVNSDRVGSLAWAGIALGVGYLTRYEIAFSAMGVAAVVGLASLRRGTPPVRAHKVLVDVLIVVFPIAVSASVWAVTGWITTGDLFATLSSQYGNTGQIATAQLKGARLGSGSNSQPLVVAARLLAMQPFVGLAVILAASVAVLRRRWDPLMPLATFGSVLAFAVWGQFTGTTFGWFRFYIAAIPLVIIVALTCWRPDEARPGLAKADTWLAKTGAVLLCLSLFVGVPVTGRAMLDVDIGNQHLQFGLRSLLDPATYPPEEQWYRRLRNDDRLIADYLDRQHLPPGSVLMESFVGWGIWLASDNPKQFVITSDFDFTAVLNRPWENGIRYVIVSNPALNDAVDRINERYPDLWSDGAGLGRVAYSAYGATGQERWRIYRVEKPQPQVP